MIEIRLLANATRLCDVHGMKITGDHNTVTANKLGKKMSKRICVYGYKNKISKNKL